MLFTTKPSQHRILDPHRASMKDSRYSRQKLLKCLDGMESFIHDASICCVGAGGVASTYLEFLVGAGVKRLTIVDYDIVEVHNLHRQVLHSEKDANVMNKAESAVARLGALNSEVDFRIIKERLTSENIESVLETEEQFDVIADCTDNPDARFLIARYCLERKIPHVFSAAVASQYTVGSFNVVSGAPCFFCLYPKPPPQELRQTAANAGVFGPVVGVSGCLAASETLKIVCYLGKLKVVENKTETEKEMREKCLVGKMIVGNVFDATQTTIRFAAKPTCMGCGKK